MQIFFMQRVMRMNFVRTTMLQQEQLQLMYVHAVCDMSSKSSAFISALVIILLVQAFYAKNRPNPEQIATVANSTDFEYLIIY